MKPQLVIQDFGGVHNKDLAKSNARLLKGGSWKKQRIVVVLPAADLIPAKVALSHWNLAFPPNNGVVRILALGMEVGDAYSTAIEEVLIHPELSKWEYILSIEHDNCPVGDAVIRLVEHMENNSKYSAISGLYFTKGEGGVAQIWGDIKDPVLNFRPQPPDSSGGLVECCGIGMGLTLFRMSMFKDKKIARPFFKTNTGKDNKGVGTQDLAFWTEVRKYGYRCAVACDVKVGHYDHEGLFGPAGMMW